MATFAQYQSQPLAFEEQNDFTLFPYQDSWNPQSGSYIPHSTYQDQSYLQTTAFDTYAHQQQYSQADLEQYSVQSVQYNIKSGLQLPEQTYSPSSSAAHSFDLQNPPILSSTSDSGASVQSTVSSGMNSPSVLPQQPHDWTQQVVVPSIVHHDNLGQDLFATTSFDYETIPVTDKGCVDPALIQPSSISPTQHTGSQFPEMPVAQSPQPTFFPSAPSPIPFVKQQIQSPRSSIGKAPSPYLPPRAWQPYPAHPPSRRQSISSVHSRNSQASLGSDDSNKGLCPIPTCGRHVKDLKAHMLTHQNERPEKCPIPTCEYHIKGFARKYDKNRHTLTHYKGTMVCGFCPGSGSAAEKSFNRADVFKRHLTSVHGVEQTPPNARRKSPASASGRRSFGVQSSGMCSTCGNPFSNAQDFYEHLDDCVLRVVQQAEPSEAINEKLLSSVANDEVVQQTMEKHQLPTGIDLTATTTYDDDEDNEEDDDDEDDTNDSTYGSGNGKSGKGSLKSRKPNGNPSSQLTHPRGVSTQHVGGGNHLTTSGAVGKPGKGLTRSKNGVPLAGPMSGKGNKRRKNYPLSWGAAPEKMRMRKRVLCVYDGQRRLWKDDMMLDANHEVRIRLPGVGDGRAWITDLDVQTLRRAEGLHNATEEEKGPWMADEDELERLMQ